MWAIGQSFAGKEVVRRSVYSGCPLYVCAWAVFAFCKYAVRVTSCVCASCALTTNGVRVTSCVCTTIGVQGASRVHPTTKRGQRVSYMCKQRVHVELRTMCKLRVHVACARQTVCNVQARCTRQQGCRVQHLCALHHACRVHAYATNAKLPITDRAILM